MALISCRECGHDVSSLAATCPNCGAPTAVTVLPGPGAAPKPPSPPLYKRPWVWGLVIAAAVAAPFLLDTTDDTTTVTTRPVAAVAKTTTTTTRVVTVVDECDGVPLYSTEMVDVVNDMLGIFEGLTNLSAGASGARAATRMSDTAARVIDDLNAMYVPPAAREGHDLVTLAAEETLVASDLVVEGMRNVDAAKIREATSIIEGVNLLLEDATTATLELAERCS